MFWVHFKSFIFFPTETTVMLPTQPLRWMVVEMDLPKMSLNKRMTVNLFFRKISHSSKLLLDPQGRGKMRQILVKYPTILSLKPFNEIFII